MVGTCQRTFETPCTYSAIFVRSLHGVDRNICQSLSEIEPMKFSQLASGGGFTPTSTTLGLQAHFVSTEPQPIG